LAVFTLSQLFESVVGYLVRSANERPAMSQENAEARSVTP